MENILIFLGIVCAGLLWAVCVLWTRVNENKRILEDKIYSSSKELLKRLLERDIENLESVMKYLDDEIGDLKVKLNDLDASKNLKITNCKDCKNFRELNGKPFCRVIGGVRETYVNIEQTEGLCYRFIEK